MKSGQISAYKDGLFWKKNYGSHIHASFFLLGCKREMTSKWSSEVFFSYIDLILSFIAEDQWVNYFIWMKWERKKLLNCFFVCHPLKTKRTSWGFKGSWHLQQLERNILNTSRLTKDGQISLFPWSVTLEKALTFASFTHWC